MKPNNLQSLFIFCFFTIFNLIIFNPESGYAQMFWNQTASFAGNSSSYIAVPNSSSIDITGNFSIEVWINPSSVTGAAKGIISKGGALGTSLKYALRLAAGRIQFITNGAPRLTSKVNSVISTNTWTHVTATYSASTGNFKLYLNGNIDTSSTVAAASPVTNTDSLYIGISGTSTPYSGQMDEVRLWNKELPSTVIDEYYRISLSENRNIYTGLVMSMTFQDENSSGIDFNTRDMTGNGNNGIARNITSFDQSNNPYSTIHPNLAVTCTGSSYMSCKDTSVLDASSAITLECWIYPTSLSAATYISKGSTASPVYFFGWNGTKLIAKINGSTITLNSGTITLNKWNHVSFTYKDFGSYNFYINGDPKFTGFSSLGSINNSTDSLYIGGGPGSLSELSGYIDEVRIIKDFFSNDPDIKNRLHSSIDQANDPSGYNIISYNLDGSLIDNSNNGGPKLNIINGGEFSYPASSILIPTSPIGRDESGKLSTGFYIKSPSKDIPLFGIIYDTIQINEFQNLNDVNLFIGVNHSIISDIEITLKAPNGDSVIVFNQNINNAANNNISAVFDDQADSIMQNNRYTTFANTIKPLNSLNAVLNGKNSQGKWILKINDKVNGNNGTLYGWGLQFNNNSKSRINLKVSSLIQGFYNLSSHLQVPDTLKLIMANPNPPYNILDTSVTILSDSGTGLYSVNQDLFRQSFYLVLKHRNSIETWSSSTTTLSDDKRFYTFISSNTRAFGNNMTQIDASPLKFAVYNGDVNQDGIIDGSDISDVENDASNALSGYVNTDATGDDFVDGSDVSLVENNAANSVSVITP